jgi:hypothetical protein
MLKFPANVAALAKLAAAENPRYALNAVLVSERPEGYQIEATDGRRLGIARGPGAESERHPRLADAPNGATEALIPAKDFADLVRMGKGYRNESLLVLGDVSSTFLAAGKVISVPNREGLWPRVDAVLPMKPPAAEFTASARYLCDLLQVAAGFGDEGNGNVLIRFWDANTPVAVQTANSNGQSFFGLVMPVTGQRLAPPIEPELPAWVEQLAEAAEDLLRCTRKPNGDRLKTVKLADCLEQVGRLEVAVQVAKAALADQRLDAGRANAGAVTRDQASADDPRVTKTPSDGSEIEDAADEPAPSNGHQRNGQPH